MPAMKKSVGRGAGLKGGRTLKVKPESKPESAKTEDKLESDKPKKRRESKLPAHLRRGKVTLLEIRQFQNFLIEHAQIFGDMAAKMDKLAIKDLDEVDGVTKGVRGQELLATFTANINRSLSDARFSS